MYLVKSKEFGVLDFGGSETLIQCAIVGIAHTRLEAIQLVEKDFLQLANEGMIPEAIVDSTENRVLENIFDEEGNFLMYSAGSIMWEFIEVQAGELLNFTFQED